MDPATIKLALSLLQIIRGARETLASLKTDSPEVYAHIAEHHADALAAAEAEASA